MTGEDLRAKFPTIDSLVAYAQEQLAPEVWDYVSGGAGSETTLRRNRLGYERIGFRPTLMHDVRGLDTSCDLFGQSLALPVMLAPVGSIGRYHAGGPIAVAEVAEKFQALTFVGSVAEPGITEVRERVKSPLGYQLYVRGDRDWIADRVRVAEEAECSVLCVTADGAASGRRERNLVNDYSPAQDLANRYQAFFTWADFAWLRSVTDLPLMVKGIMSADDARRAEDAGANGVYVSNHGGRQLDHLPGTIEVLPEVVEAVSDGTTVLIDGGVIHGADVVKALALGAHGVGIGKLMVWSLAAGGQSGLERALEILRDEILNVMALLGVTSLEELNPRYVRDITLVPPSEWIGFRPGSTETGPTVSATPSPVTSSS